jgi:acyl transferase domain-containing protein
MEPIAIIGIGCRFPAASGPREYWRLLAEGHDAVREIPAARWPVDAWYDPDADAPGRMSTRWGAFLEHVDQFDPNAFSLTPREAAHMDPQQRLLLEVALEALEDAGLPLNRLAGSPTGVFVGFGVPEYYVFQVQDPQGIDGHTLTGTFPSICANRISYVFDFRGPSVALDTACSSSLVAVHLACQSLRSGESTLALAGGVNLMLSPAVTVGLSKLKAMSPDGCCRTFDAAANGYVRGEGAGLVVLKPLAAAERDRDRIYAVIRGSAINQDGRTNGLTAPNSLSQEAVLRAAYAAAEIDPAIVDYVETHGTGTLLGDPIELTALGRVVGAGRANDRPCRIGSVKTNIGHLEAAAGVASLVKVALALTQRAWPGMLHFQTPNPNIPFDRLPFAVQQTCEPWPPSMVSAVAGISAFGFGGTNAHVVLASPAVREDREKLASPGHSFVLALSARTEEALRALVALHREELSRSPGSAADICFTAAVGRAPLAHRFAAAGNTATELRDTLDAWLCQCPTAAWTGRKRFHQRTRVALVLTPCHDPELNNGTSYWPTAFQDTIAACRRELGALPPELAKPREIEAGFIVPYAAAVCWRAWGIEPSCVIVAPGSELVALCLAECLPLASALRLACAALSGQAVSTMPIETVDWREPQLPLYEWASGNPLESGSLCLPDVAPASAPWFESTPHWSVDCELLLRSGPIAALAEPGQAAFSSAGLEQVLGRLFAAGFDLRWDELFRGQSLRRVAAPTYPFQREVCWFGPRPGTPDAHLTRAPRDAGAHPLLGRRLRSPVIRDAVFETEWTLERPPAELADAWMSPVPEEVFRRLARGLAETVHGGLPRELSNVRCEHPCLLRSGDPQIIQTILTSEQEVRIVGLVKEADDLPPHWVHYFRCKLNNKPPTPEI